MIDTIIFFILFNISLVFLYFGALISKKIYKGNSASILLSSHYLLIIFAAFVGFWGFLPDADNPFGTFVKIEESTSYAKPVLTPVLSIPITEGSRPIDVKSTFHYGNYLILLWVIGALLRLMITVRGWLFLKRIAEKSILIKRYQLLKIISSETAESPYSFRLFNKYIVLPSNYSSCDPKMKVAIRHEYLHHKQGDTIVIYFGELFKVLFWWNPFVYWYLDIIESFQEMSVDEKLLSRGESAQRYGETLLYFAKKTNNRVAPVGAVGMALRNQQLKWRIHMILSKEKKRNFKYAQIGLAALIVALVSFASATNLGIKDYRISKEYAESLADNVTGTDIPIQIDQNVLYWLNKAVGSEKSRKAMRSAIQRMENYKSMISEKLKQGDLPLELMAIPLMESGYKNNVRSPAKARGIWQFIPGTARRMGLIVNEEIDERLNPNRLTDAAVLYYTKLFAIFQNWPSAMVAYNIGESRLARILGEQGHNRILELSAQGVFGEEGSSYLPKAYAAMIIIENPELLD